MPHASILSRVPEMPRQRRSALKKRACRQLLRASIAIALVFSQKRINVQLNMGQGRISRETWEQVKIAYAAGGGLREIARKMSIPEGTVLAHAKRNSWTQQIEAAKQEAKPMQSNVITPLQALATTVNERKDKSRLHLSKYVVDASERAAQSNGNLEIAGQVRKVAQVHESVWPHEQQPPYSPLNLQVLSQNTVLAIHTEAPDSA